MQRLLEKVRDQRYIRTVMESGVEGKLTFGGVDRERFEMLAVLEFMFVRGRQPVSRFLANQHVLLRALSVFNLHWQSSPPLRQKWLSYFQHLHNSIPDPSKQSKLLSFLAEMAEQQPPARVLMIR